MRDIDRWQERYDRESLPDDDDDDEFYEEDYDDMRDYEP